MVELKISDQQGAFAVHNLTVTVCECTATPSCRGRRASSSTMGFGAVGVLLFALLVLLSNMPIPFLWFMLNV